MGREIEFKFDGGQSFQLQAINSVIKIFEGQPLCAGSASSLLSSSSQENGIIFEDGIISNSLDENVPILNNVQKVQEENKVQVSELLEACEVKVEREGYENSEVLNCALNFTVEMETGTGKTYTYIRTCYEMNKVYGFKKFVIVVPSVAIREGVMQSLNDTHKHFQKLYSNIPIEYTLFDSSKKTQSQKFARCNSIQILVINIDSFTKDSNIINKVNEYGLVPITYIQKTNPIVILDEPQNMETEIRKRAIVNLNPLCTLRYSATHRNYYNLLYSLNPVQAYDLGLVKQIEVDGITISQNNYNDAFIKVNNIVPAGKRGLKAKLTIYVNEGSGVKKKNIDVQSGDNLYDKSFKREMYKNNFIVEGIDLENQTIKFANGLVLSSGMENGGLSDEVMKYQMERTIISHFEKEAKLKKKGIKVLSLFFIDRVANYRTTDKEYGKFAIWFEELFNEYAPKDYLFTAQEVHNGYFSQDRNGLKDTKEGRDTKADDEAYELIMKDKKRLLKEDEPLRFLFSHSALREGWDNPNVFQICTLNETHSEIKKRQEIGRGMRLPVDSKGERCFDKSINILTIVANESYADFSSALQKEIQEDTSVSFEGRIKNKRERVKLKHNKELTVENYPEFFKLWDKIKYQTRYNIEYKTHDLIANAVKAIDNIETLASRPQLLYARNRLIYTQEGVEGRMKKSNTKSIDQDYLIPNVFAYIQSKIDISKQTISTILKRSNRLNDIYLNPQMFLDNVVLAIRGELNILLVEGIKYEKLNDKYYEMALLDNEDIERYLVNLEEIKDNKERTIFNYIEVDSEVERSFAQDCQYNSRVKFFFKLPKRGFRIPTPIGAYFPDWVVVLEEGINNKVYFVAETKNTLSPNERRPEENMKIDCGKKWNKEINDVKYQVCSELSQLYN